jgi:MarR family 2-MHQ and catechol resistance regulon transcriptional repressor
VLWKATRTLESIARRHVEGLGLCLSDFGVLEALLHKGPLPVNALGAKVLLTSGSMTAAVDRLDRRRLVKRQDDPDDRRARVVHLTAAGRKLIRGLFASHEQAMDSAVSVLTAKERATLLGLLRKLGRGAEGLEGPAKGLSGSGQKRGRAALGVRTSKRRRQ